MAKFWLMVFVVTCLSGCTTFNDLTATQITPCTNGVRDPGELGVDCGPVCSRTCDGEACGTDTQCASAKCSGGVCAATAGKKCGVGLANECNGGDGCGVDADCTTDYCNTTCMPPGADVHTDGRRNGGETGTDCGGGTAPACPASQGCKTNDDCLGVCQADKTCAGPSPTDGKKNGDETDVDCGGATAPKCVIDKVCLANSDCELDACTAGKCVMPTSTDGVTNGGETDVDCGGNGVSGGGVTYQAPRCTVDKTCAAGTDCLTGACSPGLKCEVPSCSTASTAGITSCGTMETGQAGAVHDSCCTSLVMPTRTTRRLDKYEITSGRFRSFVNYINTSAGSNLRAWAQKYATDHPTSQLATLMASFPVVTSILPATDTDGDLSLTAHLSQDIDNYDGVRGCYNGTNNYAANTYWQDATHQAVFQLPPRTLPQATSDEKPMNCAMPLLFTAFCAWDGGELATAADYADVWPTAQPFPWGATNFCTRAGGMGVPGSYFPCDAYNWCNGPTGTGNFTCEDTTTWTALDEAGMFYEFPRNTIRANDNEPLIAAPGRFPKDLTAAKSANGEGWFDLFANLAEYTGDFAPRATADQLSTFCDFTVDAAPGATTCTRMDHDGQIGTQFSGIPQVGIVGSTWEGHQYGPGVANAFPVTFQYGKFGARCVRPATAY